MTKERRLGRGLEALLGRPTDAPAPAYDFGRQLPDPSAVLPATASTAGAVAATPASDDATGLVQLPLHAIDRNPFQPRREFDPADIAELASSLAEHGLLQPVVVRHRGDGGYELIAGERRLRAALQAGWTTIPAQVREADDRQMAEIAIVENLHRRDLGALEKAASFQAYLARYGGTQEDLARRLQLDRSTISNLLRLLELPAGVQDALRGNLLTPGHARALLALGDENEQLHFAGRIQAEQLSVRQVEELVQQHVAQADAEPLVIPVSGSRPPLRGKRSRSEHQAQLEHELRVALGTRVDLKQTASGRGKIVVHFKNHDEFERLRAYLAGGERRDAPPREATRRRAV